MRPATLAAFAAIGILLGAARGQAAPVDVKAEIAKKHYELGAKLYEASNWTEALVEFKKAYALIPKPGLLYNIARCYEVMGEPARAVEYYERFLVEKPDSDERSLIEARIANLRARIRPAPTPEPAPPVPAASRPDAPSQLAPRPPRSWRWTTGWVAAGLGGASLVAGIAFGALASGKSGEFNDGVRAGQTFAELDEIDSSGKRYQTLAIATLVAGGVLAAGGAGLLIWETLRRGRTEQAGSGPSSWLRIWPVVSTTGGAVTAGGRF